MQTHIITKQDLIEILKPFDDKQRIFARVGEHDVLFDRAYTLNNEIVIESFSDDIDENQKIIDRLEEDNSKLTQEVESLEEKNGKLEDKIEDLKSDKIALKEQIESLEEGAK